MSKTVKIFLVLCTLTMILSCKEEAPKVEEIKESEITEMQEKVGLMASDFVSKYFKNQSIFEVKNTRDGFEIELTNGVEIEFDINGNVLEIDGNDQVITTEMMPDKILEQLNLLTQEPLYVIEYEHKNENYRVKLQNGETYHFASDFSIINQ